MPEQAAEEKLIRNISDTARWVAVYRARETDRADAVFRDPFARRLAGERGEKIANSMPLGVNNDWSMIARTYIIDGFVRAQVRNGVDLVVNLAAGLDSRPYRMELPRSLRWVEVDLDEILSYKEEILRDEKPVCDLERIRLDLADVGARRELFVRLGQRTKKALVMTEGLVIYLTSEAVGELAEDLAAVPTFRSWIVDVASPGLLKMLKRRIKQQLHQAAPFKFAPEEGPAFFEKFGWKAVEAQSVLKNAAKLKRLPFFLKLVSYLPETPKSRRDRPWSGICLFEKKSAA